MNKLKELIEWMEEVDAPIGIIKKAKSLQEQDGWISVEVYTQEEIDKAWEEGFKRGLNQCQEGAILIGEPFRK